MTHMTSVVFCDICGRPTECILVSSGGWPSPVEMCKCEKKHREEGYYWVKCKCFEDDKRPDWMILRWGELAKLFDSGGESIDTDWIVEIDERRIVRSE